MIEVEIPDGTIVEFPDEMSQDDIKSVLQKKFPPSQNLGQVLSAPQPELPPQTIPYTGIPESIVPKVDWKQWQAPPTPQREQTTSEFMRGIPATSMPFEPIRGILASPVSGAIESFLERTAPERMTGVPSAAGIVPEAVPPGQTIAEAMRAAPASTLPFEPVRAVLSSEVPAMLASSVAKTGIGLAEYLSSPQGVTEFVASLTPARLLVMAKWAVDMAKGAGQEAGALSALLGKPNKTRDDWQAISDHAVNTAAMVFGAGATARGVARPVTRALTPAKVKAAQELSRLLETTEPMGTVQPRQPIRQLGIPQAALTAEPFLQPGIQELAGQALREAQSPLTVPGRTPAIEMLRRELVPPQITPVEPTRVAERIPGGGEAPYGKVSYMRQAEAPTTERTQARVVEPPPSTTKPLRIPLEKTDIFRSLRDEGVTEENAKALLEGRKSAQRVVDEQLGVKISMGTIDADTMIVLENADGSRSIGFAPPAGPASTMPVNIGQMSHSDAILMAREQGVSRINDILRAKAPEPLPIPPEVQAAGKKAEAPVAPAKAPPAKPAEAPKVEPSEKGQTGTITFESYEEPTGQWETRQHPIVVSKSTIPGDKPWRATVFAGSQDNPVAIAHIQLDRPTDVNTPKAVSEMSEQLGRYVRNVAIESSKPTPSAKVEAPPAEPPGAPREMRPEPITPPTSDKTNILLRDWMQKASDLHEESRFMNAGNGIAAGAGGFDAWIKAETISNYLSNIRRGLTPDVAAENTKAWARQAIETHNQKRPKDLNWKRWEGNRDSQIEQMQREFNQAIVGELPKGLGEAAAPDLISKLESLKLPETGAGNTFSLPHPDAIKAIGRSTWNTAIDVAIASVKAGKAIAQAVEDAIAYLRKNVRGLDEARARANLEYVAREETRPVAAPTPAPTAPTPPTAAPVPTGTTLTDVYQRFEPIAKPFPSLKGAGAKVVESVRTGMASKFRPLDKLSEDIAKAYNASTPRNVAGIFEQLKGSTGRGEADIYRFDRDVSSLVKGAEKDFNAYMFLRRSLDRLRMDLADIERAQRGEEVPVLNRRKVSDYTIPELEAKLRLLESNLGPERVRQFEEAANRYQTYMDNALQLQVESGRMSPEIYNAIKSGNQFYAPFKVMKYFEEIAKPEGTGRKIDTLADYTKAMTGIEDPNFRLGDMLGAARQNILLSRILADKNNAMRRLAQLAEFDPDGLFIKRIEPGMEVPNDLGTVNVKENGKVVQYAVNKDVQQAIQSMGPNTESILVQFMGYAAIPMKAGATSLNIPFQVSNLMADVPRQALVSRYGLHDAADLIRYPIDFMRSAYSQIAGEVFKSDNRIFLDFLDSGAAGATIQEHLTPSALRFRPSSLEKTSKDFGKTVLYTLPDFAKAIEQISKSVGVQRAMRLHGATSGKELASFFPEAITEIRRFSGSPDFGRQGRWVEGARLNLIYMFFNARLQGTISDLGRLAGRDGAKTGARTWVNMAAAVGIPTLYLYALNHSDEYREDYLKRPEQERQNYWLIPKDTFITNEQGERIRDYWRIPKRESAKWFANFTESAMNFYNERDAEQLGAWAEAALTDISPVNFQGETFQERVESMASSLNPVMKAPLELATGRDLYRHRSIVPESMKKASPEQQYIERTPEIFRQLAQTMPDVSPEVFRSPMMLENMVKNFTAGMLLQFLPRKPIEGRSGIENLSLLQRFQAVPYTDSGDFENRMKLLEREAADTQLERFRNAKAILDANKNATLKSLITKTKEKHGIDPRLFERVADIYIAEQRGINNQERRILSLPVQQRAQFLNDEFRLMNPEQKKNAIREYAKKRILTESVAAELLKLQAAPAP